MSDNVAGFFGFIFLCLFGYWLISEPDAEDVAEKHMEALFDGDAENLVETQVGYFSWPAIFNVWWDTDISFIDLVSLNSVKEIAVSSETISYENKADRHDGLDDIEIIGSSITEDERSFSRQVVDFLASPFVVDEKAQVVAKVSYDDDYTEFYSLSLIHIDDCDFCAEGWAVDGGRRLIFSTKDTDKADEIEEVIIDELDK